MYQKISLSSTPITATGRLRQSICSLYYNNIHLISLDIRLEQKILEGASSLQYLLTIQPVSHFSLGFISQGPICDWLHVQIRSALLDRNHVVLFETSSVQSETGTDDGVIFCTSNGTIYDLVDVSK